MAQTGYTPIQLYYSTTASAVPTNTNLANGELAINITDGKLYYKDNTGTVKLLTSTGSEISPITNNGVVYINGSGQATSGSALTYDGSSLGVGTSSPAYRLDVSTGAEVVGRFARTASSNALLLIQDPTTTTAPYIASYGNSMAFGAYGGSEFGRFLSSGFLGLGTTTPSTKLHIASGAVTVANGSGSTQALLISGNDPANAGIQLSNTTGPRLWSIIAGNTSVNNTDFTIRDGTASATRLTIDSSGNLGLGVTPSAWTIGKAFQVNGASVLSTGTEMYLSANAFYGASAWTYRQSDFATQYYQLNGTHVWRTAASGTAGNAISFTQAMTLDASGNLLVGGTSAFSPDTGRGNISINGASTSVLALGVAASQAGYLFHDGTNMNLFNDKNGYLRFATNGTEQARFTSGGQFLVGNTAGASYKVIFENSGQPILALNSTDSLGGYTAFQRNGTAYGYIGSAGPVVTGGANTDIALRSENNLLFTSGGATERFRIAANGAWGLAGANYGTAGQVLTSNGSGSAPTWQAGGGGGGSAATPTALGTVYGSMTTSGGTPFLTALGYNAGSSTTGVGVTAVGTEALYTNSTGARSTAMGYRAGYSNTGNNNLFVGNQSGFTNTTGTGNSFVGGMDSNNWPPGYYNTSGSDNSAFGGGALRANTTGSFNTAVGTDALHLNTTAGNSTAIGFQSLYSNTTGTDLTAVGRETLRSNTTGYSNSAFGIYALYSNTTAINNTAVGREALYSNSTASHNTAVGYQAGYSNTTGGVTAVGFRALQANTTGINNTAIGGRDGGGYGALHSNTTGNYNAAVGDGSMAISTTAERCVAVGYAALNGLTTGNYNTAVGFNAGAGITTGVENTFMGLSAGNSGNGSGIIGIGYQAGRGGGSNSVWIGYNAGQGTTNSGTYNVGLGFYAGVGNTTGSSNVFIGYNVGGSNTTGANNVFIGSEAGNATGAGMANTTASGNVGIGASALRSNTTAERNTAVGNHALYSTTTAGQNVAVGYYAASGNTTGVGNVCVGDYAGVFLTTGSDNICIGKLAGYNQNIGPVTTGSSNILIGNDVGLAASSNNYCINISPTGGQGKGSSTGFINPGTGGVYQGNNSSTWSQTSDQRLKKNIVNNDIGLEKLTQIQVRNFEYRTEDEVTELPKEQAIKKQGVQLGVIAQELQQILPECVKTESTGVMTVDTDNLTWYLINAVKQLKAEIDQLKGN